MKIPQAFLSAILDYLLLQCQVLCHVDVRFYEGFVHDGFLNLSSWKHHDKQMKMKVEVKKQATRYASPAACGTGQRLVM